MHIKINYDEIRSKAERLHIHALHIVSLLLTLHLWLMIASLVYVSRGIHLISVILVIWNYLMIWGLSFWVCVFSKRLRILKRIMIGSVIWIPVLHFFTAIYICRLAKQEIDHSLHKIALDDVRVENQICHTQYPILLVHGVGFRDLHYFNYWGRIPRELVRNGARVYYGHQEAWGTVEDKGEALKHKIQEIMAETGSAKVNIIAHSKGGLDARYLISGLDMKDCIASLTTINTPHHGSKLVDLLKHLPDKIYRAICGQINRSFTHLGDVHPDAYHASYQLSYAYSLEFNRMYPDQEGIYYQSYASLMKSGLSSKLLCIPYWILKILDAPNDGLVTVESATWTHFRGVVRSKHLRGISHGDVIDLTREDYQGFDVIEFYVGIVKELKSMGL